MFPDIYEIPLDSNYTYATAGDYIRKSYRGGWCYLVKGKENKLYTNRDRDRRNQETLSTMGWNVITVWECELKKNKREETLNKLYRQIIDQKNSL